MAVATETGRPQSPPPPAASRRKRVTWTRVRHKALPYLLLLPAVCFELLVHIVPMLVGIWISFKQLTVFFIRDWTSAPDAGLMNYRFALNFNNAVGQALLQSFLITLGFTVLVVEVGFDLQEEPREDLRVALNREPEWNEQLLIDAAERHVFR